MKKLIFILLLFSLCFSFDYNLYKKVYKGKYYTVIETFNIKELIKKANNLYKIGFKPQGGICVVHLSGSSYYYTQAFFREKLQ